VDLEWREIEPLRTIQEPGEPMPRLRELLEYLSEPGLEDIWVLLDIKVGFRRIVLKERG
jgi:phosphatidylglycerol phospholipase C